jgi:hypothetical protein
MTQLEQLLISNIESLSATAASVLANTYEGQHICSLLAAAAHIIRNRVEIPYPEINGTAYIPAPMQQIPPQRPMFSPFSGQPPVHPQILEQQLLQQFRSRPMPGVEQQPAQSEPTAKLSPYERNPPPQPAPVLPFAGTANGMKGPDPNDFHVEWNGNPMAMCECGGPVNSHAIDENAPLHPQTNKKPYVMCDLTRVYA